MLFSSSIEYFDEGKLATSGILQILVYDTLDNWTKSILKIKNKISKICLLFQTSYYKHVFLP